MNDDPKPEPEPTPELLAEAKAFAAEIEALCDLPDNSRGEPLRFTITVPREQAIMAAWVMFKEDTKARHGLASVLGRPVMLHLDDGRRGSDWDRAKRYFQRAIFREFDTDYTNLLLKTHPLLFPSPPKAEPASDTEDGIPF